MQNVERIDELRESNWWHIYLNSWRTWLMHIEVKRRRMIFKQKWKLIEATIQCTLHILFYPRLPKDLKNDSRFDVSSQYYKGTSWMINWSALNRIMQIYRRGKMYNKITILTRQVRNVNDSFLSLTRHGCNWNEIMVMRGLHCSYALRAYAFHVKIGNERDDEIRDGFA